MRLGRERLVRALFPTARLRRRYRSEIWRIPADVPWEIDIGANLTKARRVDPVSFALKVKTEGDWDYKHERPELEPFGNFHFGLTYKATWWGGGLLGEEFGLRAAGGYQEFFQPEAYRPENGHFYGDPPYGDGPEDAERIKTGYSTYDAHQSALRDQRSTERPSERDYWRDSYDHAPRCTRESDTIEDGGDW